MLNSQAKLFTDCKLWKSGEEFRVCYTNGHHVQPAVYAGIRTKKMHNPVIPRFPVVDVIVVLLCHFNCAFCCDVNVIIKTMDFFKTDTFNPFNLIYCTTQQIK